MSWPNGANSKAGCRRGRGNGGENEAQVSSCAPCHPHGPLHLDRACCVRAQETKTSVHLCRPMDNMKEPGKFTCSSLLGSGAITRKRWSLIGHVSRYLHLHLHIPPGQEIHAILNSYNPNSCSMQGRRFLFTHSPIHPLTQSPTTHNTR